MLQSGHRWDKAVFDPERQEKFNKLMVSLNSLGCYILTEQ